MYQFNDISVGAGGSAAGLSLERALFRPPVQPTFGQKVSAARSRAAKLDLVVDLGLEVGSRRWLQGFATCAALCIAAFGLAPTLGRIPGASPPPLGEVQHEEMRALSIAPLAYGADTGRRMAATDAVEALTDMPERPSIDLVATLAPGDGFTRVLERAGVASAEAAEVGRMVAAIVPLEQIRPGTAMEVRLGRRPHRQMARPLEALAFRARFDLRLSLRRIDGKLTIAESSITVDDTPLRIQGVVGLGLYRSARAAGAPPRAVESFIRAIAGQMSIGEVGPGDRFDFIVQHRRAETGESEFGNLLYAGLERSDGRAVQLMPWAKDGKLQWFEASGVGKEQGLLQRPVPGAMTSSFGFRRHPILGYTRFHRGVDFQAGFGTPILAATDGRVTATGWAGGYGRQVRIAHGGGLLSTYSHMSRIAAEPGAIVRQGDVIGYVGSSGLSTGPHLHYELYRNGVPIDPASARFLMRAQLSGAELESFRARLRSLLSLPTGAVEESRPRG